LKAPTCGQAVVAAHSGWYLSKIRFEFFLVSAKFLRGQAMSPFPPVIGSFLEHVAARACLRGGTAAARRGTAGGSELVPAVRTTADWIQVEVGAVLSSMAADLPTFHRVCAQHSTGCGWRPACTGQGASTEADQARRPMTALFIRRMRRDPSPLRKDGRALS
jgi:hypothetical protein